MPEAMSGLDTWLERPYIERARGESLWEFAAESLEGKDACDEPKCSKNEHCDDCINRRCNELIEDAEDAETERKRDALEDREMFPEDY